MIADTNAVSAMADGDPALERVLREATSLSIPVIVLGEYAYGIAHSHHRARYEDWLSELLGLCRVLPVDRRTAEHYAAIRSELRRRGVPVPSNDLWIAALAWQHSLPVLSRDGHFDLVPGLVRVSW